MAIEGYNRDNFVATLPETFSPATAVRSVEDLKGRAANLEQISRAFATKGRHVFIYGDRGVGKTSLALSSAYIHQSSDAEPIVVSCDSDTTVYSLVRDITNQALGQRLGKIEKKSTNVGFNFKFLSASKAKEVTSGNVPEIETLNEATDLIRYLSVIHSIKPVVVIDEFDRVSAEKTRRKFAEFLKKISDDDISTKFIICGIAKNMDDLIDEHLSVARNLASIELNRLSHDARWEIIANAASRFGVNVPRDMLIRIGQISDGFPHYVHLLGEKIFWSIFDDEKTVKSAKKRHFDQGVAAAILEAEALPRIAYRKATEKYTDDYCEVLWSLADGPKLRRQTSEVYQRSYLEIMKKRSNDDRVVLDKTKFSNRLNRLKTDAHGSIIRGTGGGWYEYSDNVVRGYVRLMAQQQGIEIGDGYYNAADM